MQWTDINDFALELLDAHPETGSLFLEADNK